MPHSAQSKTVSKPSKPSGKYAPLTEHPNGQLVKKCGGRTFYFGCKEDHEAALARYRAEWDYIKANGCRPEPVTTPAPVAPPEPAATEPAGLTLETLCREFLQAKRARTESGELTARTWRDYQSACQRLLKFFGRRQLAEHLSPDDFARLRISISKRRTSVALGNELQRIRTIFKWGYAQEKLSRPARFGDSFEKPRKAVLRIYRAKRQRENGARMLEAAEIRRLLADAGPALKAMTLLGLSCGLGATDVANLRLHDLDLDAGWITFPRPKTGIERRAKLWPEVVTALREWLAVRPEAKRPEDRSLAFVTRFGQPWVKVSELTESTAPSGEVEVTGGTAHDSVGLQFNKLLRKLGLKRPGLGFYALRHGTETIGGGACDQIALNLIMGHVDPSMASHYRESIGDARLEKIADHIHAWLWPEGWEAADKAAAEERERQVDNS